MPDTSQHGATVLIIHQLSSAVRDKLETGLFVTHIIYLMEFIETSHPVRERF